MRPKCSTSCSKCSLGGSNSRLSAHKTDALPTELSEQRPYDNCSGWCNQIGKYLPKTLAQPFPRVDLVEVGFEPTKHMQRILSPPPLTTRELNCIHFFPKSGAPPPFIHEGLFERNNGPPLLRLCFMLSERETHSRLSTLLFVLSKSM